jgi:hypothetical protein
VVGGKNGSAIVSVFLPKRDSYGGWECDYRIVLPKRRLQRTIHGADSLHALMLTLEGMQAEVLLAEKRREIKLDWQGSKFRMPSRLKNILKPE